MALLVIYNGSGASTTLQAGDVVEVLEVGQHPGSASEAYAGFSYINVAGTRADWEHLLDSSWVEVVLDVDDTVKTELIFEREVRTDLLDDPGVALLASTLGTVPTVTPAALNASIEVK